jgi:hypothetical protein
MNYVIANSAEFAAALTAIAGTPGSHDTITFAADIAINEPMLAPITKDPGFKLTIDGAGFAITASTIRPFFIAAGEVEINDLTISHAVATGGNGGNIWSGGGGGGGMGAGGALFVADHAIVTLTDVTFADNSAIGGKGGTYDSTYTGYGAGGGGGLAGNGGNGGDAGTGDGGGGGGGGGFYGAGGSTVNGTSNSAGGGGGGLSADGANAASGVAGLGGGAEGGKGGSIGNPASSGVVFGGGGGAVELGLGGAGGAYGGGGGSGFGISRPGGAAGFGGGGGGGYPGGVAGFGGGAGGSAYINGNFYNGGSGGSGYGGSIFVQEGGSLTIVNSAISGGMVTGGVAGLGYNNQVGGSAGNAAGAGLYLHGNTVVGLAPTTAATIASDIAGSGGLAKTGTGTLTLSATNSYLGATTVSDGMLVVDGSIAASSGVTVTGGTLAGSGTVSDLSVQQGGTVSPGNSPGTLTTGNLAFSTGATYKAELGGAGAGQFDVLNVHGTVDLGGATLDLSLINGFNPTTQSFVIVENDGNDAVTGIFAGAAEGATIAMSGRSFSISYHGGDGNDVALTAIAIPPPPSEQPVTDADVARAFHGMTALTISTQDAASVGASIRAGTLTLDAYIASLIPQAQHTTVPALVISQFFGAPPSQAHLGELAAFNAAQLVAYTKAGVADPALGPFEALGLGFSDTLTFGNKYSGLSDADFLGKAYQDVFGRAPTADQTKHFAEQIQYFETRYMGAGQTAAHADLHAKGAILGQMLGFAVIHEPELHSYDDAAIAFLQSAAKGQAHYGEGILV